MTQKKTKQSHKTPSEVKEAMADLSEEKEQAIDKECVEEIEVVLKKYNRALDPFISRTERGSQARVRLARVSATQEDDGETEE